MFDIKKREVEEENDENIQKMFILPQVIRFKVIFMSRDFGYELFFDLHNK